MILSICDCPIARRESKYFRGVCSPILAKPFVGTMYFYSSMTLQQCRSFTSDSEVSHNTGTSKMLAAASRTEGDFLCDSLYCATGVTNKYSRIRVTDMENLGGKTNAQSPMYCQCMRKNMQLPNPNEQQCRKCLLFGIHNSHNH